MKKILVIGSGKSAVTLIDYLLNESVNSNWNITIADYNIDHALKSAKNHINSRPISFDINDVNQRNQEIDLDEYGDLIIIIKCKKQKTLWTFGH